MIRRILIANRGEIARRVMRTCRNLSVETVAVYSDTDAGEPHVREADFAVALHGTSAAETYLDRAKIVAAAVGSGADAVHPGYGFLSENAEFARAVADAGLTWIGPSPEAIAAMGSKIEAKSIMQSAGVPCLPDLVLDGLDEEDLATRVESIGYPVLIKASAGGGGKGMRVVDDPAQLADAVASARREARSAFGDDTLFAEKYLTGPRHIEIQVFGDGAGNVVSLFERECSVQRRHQKVIEECPSPVMTEDLRTEMGKAAVDAAHAVDYVGAGTVEFLYEDGEFFFLEMNTRLQVEHPVTEEVTGLDLVELQIRVAQGEVLPPGVLEAGIEGHAIEARIYAEDPSRGFLPATGPVESFDFRQLPGLRVDSGVEPGSRVSVHFDPMMAKVVAHAPTRSEAAATLARALRSARIHGPTNNREMLVRVLEHPVFLDGDATTAFIEETGVDVLSAPLIPDEDVAAYAAGAALADRALRAGSGPLSTIPPGFRNVGTENQTIGYDHDSGPVFVTYEVSRSGVALHIPSGVEIGRVTPSAVTLSNGRRRLDLQVARYGQVRHVDSEAGPVRLTELPRFPEPGISDSEGSLHAPMPGKIVRIEVGEGDEVATGDALAVLEAMKMEHTLRAPHGGRVAAINCTVGDQVEARDVLIVIS